jgi:hypothetical protein
MLVKYLGSLYSKLPDLNPEIREVFVKLLPFASLIAGFLITFASIMEILGTPFISVFTLSSTSPLLQTLLIINILGIFQGILMVSAFRALRLQKEKGWKLIFWSQILWVISAAISLSLTFVLGIIFLYILFQVRSYYK